MKKLLFALIIIATGCKTSRESFSTKPTTNLTANGKLFASFFQQRAAEYDALCFQAYNIAHIRLNEALQKSSGKPLAIITDIDETVLDNSPYAVKQSLNGKDYEQTSWEEWTNTAQADTIAGAVSFYKYAASKGVKIFYVTNRSESERVATLKNLVKWNFPDATNDQLILRGTVSSKESRRQSIAEKYEICLFIGDNLSDFSSNFDKKQPHERTQNVILSNQEFGKKFIILPNPTYGDWESSIYNYQYNLTPVQKDSLIKNALKGY